MQIDGIESLHHIHCWTIDGESHVLSAHLVIGEHVEDAHALKARVRALLDGTNFEHVTLETERSRDHCPQEDHFPIY